MRIFTFVLSYCLFAMIEDYKTAFRRKEEFDQKTAFEKK